MRLEAIEGSALTVLMIVWRPSGQLFLPGAAVALQERYSFQGLPAPTEFFEGEVFHFRHGEFKGSAFDLSIYSDGVIVKSSSNTEFLDEVLEDILGWSKEKLGLVESQAQTPQRFYESSVVVSMDLNLQNPLIAQLAGTLSSYQKKYGLRDAAFDLAGVSLAVDNTAYVGRKPSNFTLARRVNVPFDRAVYFSTAPLKTGDHLEQLELIEQKLRA